MRDWQRIIKYLAMAFGIYLAITIIGFIVGIIGMVGTGMFAAKTISSTTVDKTVDFTKTYSGVESLDIDISNSDFNIMQGQEFKIEAYDISESCEIQLDNDTLKIKEKKMKFFRTNSPKIILYIPSDAILKNVKINLGVSNSNISNITCDNFKMNVGAGNVNLQSVKSNTSNLDCGAGNVEISDTVLENADLNCGVGKFDFEGQITGNSEVNCGVGNVNLNLVGTKDTYKLITENGIGTMTINGTKLSERQTTGDGENKINVSGGIGSVTINLPENQ